MQPGPPYPYPAPAPPAKKSSTWIIILVVVLGGGVLLIGTLVLLAVYSTRRFVASAKTAEAKNTIGAIARAARQSYEREREPEPDGSTHALCKSAITVPAAVPAGTKYMPAASGADFDTGDGVTGWKCLRFMMIDPIYYQYQYPQGSGYLARSIDPGPTGFEAAARGDLDGDGDTSLFAVTGRVSGGTVTVSPSIVIENEFE
jgi:type IV pilus assembly protein PilA